MLNWLNKFQACSGRVTQHLAKSTVLQTNQPSVGGGKLFRGFKRLTLEKNLAFRLPESPFRFSEGLLLCVSAAHISAVNAILQLLILSEVLKVSQMPPVALQIFPAF